MTSGPFAPAGWYPDPSGEHVSRYWDGAAWTDHVSEAPPTHGPGSASASPSTPGTAVVKFVALLVAVIFASSVVTVIVMAAIEPNGADYVSRAAFDAAYTRAENLAQLVGFLTVVAAVAFAAPKVGYRRRDIWFMLIPLYSVVFLVRLLWRFAHLPEVYWSVRSDAG